MQCFHQFGIKMKRIVSRGPNVMRSLGVIHRFQFRSTGHSIIAASPRKMTYLFGNYIVVRNTINMSQRPITAFKFATPTLPKTRILFFQQRLMKIICVRTFFLSLLRPYTMSVSFFVFPVTTKNRTRSRFAWRLPDFTGSN